MAEQSPESCMHTSGEMERSNVDSVTEENRSGGTPEPREDTLPEETLTSFRDLGVSEVLCEACEQLGWKKPTKIQIEAIPVALQGRDVIALAETGSGKTAAFALPILQSLLASASRLHSLVLTPTRELAFQIAEQFQALGASIGVSTAVIVGGVDMMSQALILAKKPHVVIATPGRLMDHLENTKGFNLRALKTLVMDEADRILNLEFESESAQILGDRKEEDVVVVVVDKILKVIPRDRRTYLFSATMTKKVQKLQRAALQDPVKCSVSSKFTTDCYLVSILNELAGNSFMVFCGTCNNTQRVALMLRSLGITAIPLHGQMNQSKRLGSLNKFKAKSRSVLLATDVASRGLDIPHVDCVINFDIPTHSKDYIHRVGRTARAGRSGKSITFEEEVMMLVERVTEAQRFARMEMKESVENRKRVAPRQEVDDDEQSSGVRKKVKGGASQGRKGPR
ncbi:hypothetical protein DNTS_021005 [Danionella cerebrum]|uniref:RNA helicase n=1 Tax=Danionella cerebrum TaxID=2873325 RepID=A0A553PMZ1_9TELE|nr:hypothetical protein DNTS_021005 [Danionella translucida]